MPKRREKPTSLVPCFCILFACLPHQMLYFDAHFPSSQASQESRQKKESTIQKEDRSKYTLSVNQYRLLALYFSDMKVERAGPTIMLVTHNKFHKAFEIRVNIPTLDTF